MRWRPPSFRVRQKTRSWDDDDSPVCGGDAWLIVECGGCRTVTLVHEHWFSEDYYVDDDGPTPVVHRDLYPPAPRRKLPEWKADIFLEFSMPASLPKRHAEIYAALGMGLYALAALGTRAIVDFVVTSKAGDGNDFKAKLTRMVDKGLITQTLGSVAAATLPDTVWSALCCLRCWKRGGPSRIQSNARGRFYNAQCC